MNNKNNVKLSFVVPVYNTENFLCECVDSLINQNTKNNYEIILVDDGSTDASSDICDKYESDYSNIIVLHKKNGGVSSARLEGVKLASGEYIVCIDSDDTVHVDLIENVLKTINAYKTDIVCFNSRNIDENGKIMKVLDNDFSGFYDKCMIESIYPQLIKAATGKQFSPNLCFKAIKKDILFNCMIEMDNRIKIGEDMCLCVDCMYKAQSMYFIDKPLYNYRINNLSVTKRKKSFPWLDVDYKIDFLTKILPVNEFDFYGQICRMAVHSLFNVACSVIKEKENYNEAKKIIKENLSKEKYKKYIKDCKFTNIKEKIAHFAIKHKKIWLIKLYCRLIKR